MLFQHFEETLKSWEDKQQRYIERNLSGEYLNDMELDIVEGFADTTAAILQEYVNAIDILIVSSTMSWVLF